MANFLDRALKAANAYTMFDFACLKLSIISLGILLGAYFAKFFLGLTTILWIVFVACFGWICYRTFAGLQKIK